MNETMVLGMIKSMMKNDAEIVFTDHADQRLIQRKIGKVDIFDILSNPSYVARHRESERFPGRHNHRVFGKFDWSVVVYVNYPENIIVVTVID